MRDGSAADSLAEQVLWLRDTAIPVVVEHELPRTCDVLVVGGGYTGVAASLELARRGRAVVLLEQQALGSGASTRNGGFVHPGLKPDLGYLLRRYGELGRRLYDETVRAMELVERLIEEEEIQCDYSRRGYLYLAETRSQAAHLRAAKAPLAQVRVDGWLLEGEDLVSEVGTDRYLAGLRVDNAAAIQPARFFAGLLDAAVRAGVSAHAHTPATRIQARNGALRIQTSRGDVDARDVLIGTDGYTGALVPHLQRRIIPIDSFIIATDPLPAHVQALVSPKGHLCLETKNFLCYWRLTPDGRMLFGGRTNFAPTTVAHARTVLAGRLRILFPPLADVRVDAAWGGKVGFTFDRLPHLVRRNGVTAALGYCGGGIALATYLGTRAAQWIDGEAPPAFAELNFPSVPLYRGKPWFLRPAGALFKLEDRFR